LSLAVFNKIDTDLATDIKKATEELVPAEDALNSGCALKNRGGVGGC
jgi:hypothetical protein